MCIIQGPLIREHTVYIWDIRLDNLKTKVYREGLLLLSFALSKDVETFKLMRQI